MTSPLSHREPVTSELLANVLDEHGGLIRTEPPLARMRARRFVSAAILSHLAAWSEHRK
jgi:hypothetical protein